MQDLQPTIAAVFRFVGVHQSILWMKMDFFFFLKRRHLLATPDIRKGLHAYLLMCIKMQEDAQSRTILFKEVHLLRY